MTGWINACKLRRLFQMQYGNSPNDQKYFDLDLMIERSDELRLERARERLEDAYAVKTSHWQTQESIRQLMNRDVLQNIDDWSGLS